jgi:hypothetical protein
MPLFRPVVWDQLGAVVITGDITTIPPLNMTVITDLIIVIVIEAAILLTTTTNTATVTAAATATTATPNDSANLWLLY